MKIHPSLLKSNGLYAILFSVILLGSCSDQPKEEKEVSIENDLTAKAEVVPKEIKPKSEHLMKSRGVEVESVNFQKIAIDSSSIVIEQRVDSLVEQWVYYDLPKYYKFEAPQDSIGAWDLMGLKFIEAKGELFEKGLLSSLQGNGFQINAYNMEKVLSWHEAGNFEEVGLWAFEQGDKVREGLFKSFKGRKTYEFEVEMSEPLVCEPWETKNLHEDGVNTWMKAIFFETKGIGYRIIFKEDNDQVSRLVYSWQIGESIKKGF